MVRAVLSKGKEGDAVFQPGKMNIRMAGGKQESWSPPCVSCLWKEALWAALVHSVAGVFSIPRHLPSVAQEVGDAGMPQAAGGEFCDGGTSLFMLLDLWEWGKLFVLQRK